MLTSGLHTHAQARDQLHTNTKENDWHLLSLHTTQNGLVAPFLFHIQRAMHWKSTNTK